MDDHLLSAYRRGLGALVPHGFRAFSGSFSPTVSVRESRGERRNQERLRKNTTVECDSYSVSEMNEMKTRGHRSRDKYNYSEDGDIDFLADSINDETGVKEVEVDVKEGEKEGKIKGEMEAKEDMEEEEIREERSRNEDRENEVEKEEEGTSSSDGLQYKISAALNHKWKKIPLQWEVRLNMKTRFLSKFNQ